MGICSGFSRSSTRRRNACRNIGINVRDGEPLVGAGPGRAGRRDFRREPGDQVLVQIKAQRQKGPLRAGIRDVKGARHVHPGHEALVFAVAVLLGAQHGPLGALNDHADGRLGEAGFNPVGFMPPVMTSPSMSIGYFPCSGARWSNFSFKRLAVLAVSPLPVSIIWHNPLFLHGIKKNPFQGSVF